LVTLHAVVLLLCSGQIVVSHDRTFLNHVVTDIIHFADKKLEYYKGDYVNFEKVGCCSFTLASQAG
jgi:ATPase subunit of ABC transporter with duplicated ATPase domains